MLWTLKTYSNATKYSNYVPKRVPRNRICGFHNLCCLSRLRRLRFHLPRGSLLGAGMRYGCKRTRRPQRQQSPASGGAARKLRAQGTCDKQLQEAPGRLATSGARFSGRVIPICGASSRLAVRPCIRARRTVPLAAPSAVPHQSEACGSRATSGLGVGRCRSLPEARATTVQLGCLNGVGAVPGRA